MLLAVCYQLRAAELDPKDPTPRFVLGNWAEAVAGVSWTEKRIAAALFGKLPEVQ